MSCPEIAGGGIIAIDSGLQVTVLRRILEIVIDDLDRDICRACGNTKHAEAKDTLTSRSCTVCQTIIDGVATVRMVIYSLITSTGRAIPRTRE